MTEINSVDKLDENMNANTIGGHTYQWYDNNKVMLISYDEDRYGKTVNIKER